MQELLGQMGKEGNNRLREVGMLESTLLYPMQHPRGA